MRIDILQRLLDVREHVRVFIAQADDAVADTEGADVRHAVLEHESMDPLAAQPLRHFASLVLHVMPAVTAARADDDRHTGVTRTIGGIVRETIYRFGC